MQLKWTGERPHLSHTLTWSAKICTAVNSHQVPPRGSGARGSGARWENISPDVLWGGANITSAPPGIYIPFYDNLGRSCFWPKHDIISFIANNTHRLPYVAMANTDLRIAIVGAGEFYFLTSSSLSFVRDYYFMGGGRADYDFFV